jgi:DNA replication protein
MKRFSGFKMEDSQQKNYLPDEFFSDLIYAIDNIYELKVTIYMLGQIARSENKVKYILQDQLRADKRLLESLGQTSQEALINLNEGLNLTLERNTFIQGQFQRDKKSTIIYFPNSPRGEAALKALQSGSWQPGQDLPIMQSDRPNIFSLYEANIGPLTPMIADLLQEAEQTYPVYWIEQAMKIAVENNVRRWRYVEAILASWKERGRDEKDRRDAQEDGQRFLDDEYGKFYKTG